MGRVTTAPCGVETSHDFEITSLAMALCRLRQLLHNTIGNYGTQKLGCISD